ncbi:MAG: hypothetical protein AAGA55_02770 [Planctomycetota bacterium]
MRRLTVLIVSWMAWPVAAQPMMTDVATKQVAAPPSDITSGVVRLPEPEDLGVGSKSALVPVELPAGGGVWERSLPDGARAVLLPQRADAWSATLVAPDGSARSVGRAAELAGVSMTTGQADWIAPGRSFSGIALPAPSAAHGQRVLPEGWVLRISGDRAERGYVLIEPPHDVELYTYAEQLTARVGSPVALRSELSNNAVIRAVWADVRGPGGEPVRVDGRDGAVRFTPDQPGRYAVRVHVVGVGEDARPIELTTQHVVYAEPGAVPFGRAAATAHGSLVDLRFETDGTDRRSIVAAEVWGRRDGVPVPVCWLARVCGSERSLTLDARWIAMADVDPETLELRQLRAHDVDSMGLVAFADRVVVGGDLTGLMVPEAPDSVTPDMMHGLFGRSSVRVPMEPVVSRGVLPGHRLLLVHGYCSGGNPFTTSHFSGDIAVFSDIDQNRSHDAFALQILSQTSPMKSFGVAGHSQGGMAALHLYTFYWSGMDWARGERLIQSVGSPYQGTPLAGNVAVLGDLFGSGCGSNNDLSTSGAAQWLSTIPTSSRSNVWYWTTSFEDRPFSFDFCNIVSDLLLSDPDDGVIERSRGQLPGANNQGHREGWCHTTGMRDPAQCTDFSRNTEIDQRARR